MLGTYGVAHEQAKELSDYRFDTDVQADSDARVGDLDDVEDHGGLRPPFSRNFCRKDQIFLEFLILTQKATYYTLSGRFRDILIWKTPIVCSDHAAEQRVVKERRN